jgi:hypothetical protein
MRLLLLAALAACTPKATSRTTPAYPLLDGRCDEYTSLAAEHHDVAPGVELFVFQDTSYVWLCYTLPHDAFGPLDLVVAAPGLDEPLNLHASAQLGEWPASKPDAMPKDASSEQWWNQHGWTGMPVRFNGAAADGTIKFRPTPTRELQLGKRRFGRGTWRLRATIYGVGGGGSDAKFPAAGDHALAVW